MSLDKYTTAASGLAAELLESLSDAEVEALRAELSATSVRDWWHWRDAHESLVAAFASATVAQRARQKRFEHNRLLLTLAAVQHCMEAAALLDAAERLEPGCSYRTMAGEAGRRYQDLMAADIPDWPFDDPSPFDD